VATGSRTRLDPAARRAQLVALGLEMLRTRPLDQVVVDEIATEAGISRGLLFHYFATKRDFHVAVVQAAADELLARTAPAPGLEVLDQLRAGTAAFLDYVAENGDTYRGLVRGAAGGDPALQAVFDATRTRLTERVLDGLGVPPPAPPRIRLAVRGWIALSEEVAIDWLTAGDLPREAVLEFLDHALVRLVTIAARQG
jgi:AcrR family transcriptional regulator